MNEKMARVRGVDAEEIGAADGKGWDQARGNGKGLDEGRVGDEEGRGVDGGSEVRISAVEGVVDGGIGGG